MFNRNSTHVVALLVFTAALGLMGCSKTEQATNPSNNATSFAQRDFDELQALAKESVPEKGILVETTEFDFPELEENHKKNMARWKPIFDKYPPATSHTIILDDGTKIEIPQAIQGMDLYKSKWTVQTFDSNQRKAINAACQRETSRFQIVAGILDLPLPLRVLCRQSKR